MTNEWLSVLCYMRKQPLEMDLLQQCKVSAQASTFIDKKAQNWDRVRLTSHSQRKV